MRRSPRVLLAWLAALIVALTTARVVSGDLAALHRRAASLGPTREVVIAGRDLALGQTIEAADVHTARRFERDLPSGALSTPAAAVGRVVAVPALRDSIVLAGNLAPANRTGLDGVIPLGKRAVHVAPKDGFRPPQGAVVDVLAAFDPSVVTVRGAADAAVVVASGARVVAVDSGSRAALGGAPPAGVGVTLLVTEAEARAIAFAANAGELTLAIAPPESACCRAASP